MTEPRIWHNSRCSKSRRTLQLLKDRGFDPISVDYVNTATSQSEISAVLNLLGIDAIKLMRTGNKIFSKAGLSKSDTAETLIAAMAAHPILIERHVVIHNGKAALGRPPEAVLDIL